MATCLHSLPRGRRLRRNPWVITSMTVPARKKRAIQITNGCAANNPIFVAVEAEDHKIAKNRPATNKRMPFDLSAFNNASFSVTVLF